MSKQPQPESQAPQFAEARLSLEQFLAGALCGGSVAKIPAPAPDQALAYADQDGDVHLVIVEDFDGFERFVFTADQARLLAHQLQAAADVAEL